MSIEIQSSLTDSESEGPQSTTSSSLSFGSMNDSNLPADKMEQLIRKLRTENKQLQMRVLGVNELARLLQDRSEKVKVLEDKNKRLEIAVVRLENRCANLDQKLRAEGGPVSGPKSMQPPSIPGPSRQILETLMKENSELKKALNSMQKKGVSGYLEAVKTTQLEEVIEQQKQELDFLRGQVNMLTTTPLPPTYTGGRVEVGEQSRSGGERPSGAGGEDAGSSGNLRRQLIKMQHSLKVKDRFCSLLSDQVASLQDRIKHMKLDDTPEPEEPSAEKTPPAGTHTQETDLPESDSAPYRPDTGGQKSFDDHPQIKQLKAEFVEKKREVEGRYERIIEEQKETLQMERKEHMTVIEKLQKVEQELKRLSQEINALDKRCEDLRFHNHTLLDDKKQLQECIDQMKEAGAKVREDGGLERELRELQDSLHQKDVQHSEELRNKDREMQQLSMVLEDTEYKYVIAHSELSEIKKEHEQQLTDLKDKLDYKEIDVAAKQSEIEKLKQNCQKFQVELSQLRSKPPQPMPGIFSRDVSSSIPPLVLPPHNMQDVVAVKDIGNTYTDPTVTRPSHSPSERCETSKPETVYRMALVARNLEEEEPGQSTQQPPQHGAASQHPNSLQFRTQNPPPHHPPSPSSSMATPHHPVPGRRSPLSPHFTQTGAPPPRSAQHPPHYPAAGPPTGATTPFLSAATPMGYPQQMAHRHPLPPQQHFIDPNMMQGQPPPPQGGQYPPTSYGQGVARGPQPGAPLPPRGQRPPTDGESHGIPPGSAHHHQHHSQRRN